MPKFCQVCLAWKPVNSGTPLDAKPAFQSATNDQGSPRDVNQLAVINVYIFCKKLEYEAD